MLHIKKNSLVFIIPLLLSGCYVEKKPTDCGLYEFSCSETALPDTDYPLQTKNIPAQSPSTTPSTSRQQERMEYLEHRVLKLEQELFRLRKQMSNK